jgi:ADP-dependent NAD(P)H-hydrate dehydratase / NAD(P)H-hydrate epimerase
MTYVLTPQEMRAADAEASAKLGVDALMRNAGAAIAAYVRAVVAPGSRIVAFAGPGNNGGDAYAMREALGSEFDVAVYGPDELPANDEAARALLDGAALAVDALFGTGARLPLPGAYRAAVRALDTRTRRVLAIDVPSGVDALTGAVPGDAVRASATICMAAMKPGLLTPPARERCGELWIARIGIDDATLHAHATTFAALDALAFEALLPVRAIDADKRSAGAPLILAGSEQFPGAAILSTRAAARAGAGYVTVVTAPQAAQTLRAHLVEQVVVALRDADALLDVAKRNSALAIGPGLGLDDRTGEIVREVIARCPLPMVIDASGLFHLAKHLELLRGKAVVVTPHEGEFARLSGRGTVAPGTRVERLREFTARTGITTLLKGPATLVDDGKIMHVNATGSSALATAGTGDVLTGIIATLLSQGLSPVDAARAGAYWHGLAARYCAEERRVGVTAGDLPDALARALTRRSRVLREGALLYEFV